MTDTATSTVQKLFGIAPYFVVDDVVKSAEFYRDKLGFEFEQIWGNLRNSLSFIATMFI